MLIFLVLTTLWPVTWGCHPILYFSKANTEHRPYCFKTIQSAERHLGRSACAPLLSAYMGSPFFR
jgi:hypothetical protein